MSHATQPDHIDGATGTAETFIEDVDRGWGAWLFGAILCLVFAVLIYLLARANQPIG